MGLCAPQQLMPQQLMPVPSHKTLPSLCMHKYQGRLRCTASVWGQAAQAHACRVQQQQAACQTRAALKHISLEKERRARFCASAELCLPW